MRIISGILKGKYLKIPKNIKVRPTTDQSKEALFNILNNRFDFNKINVLDLFSGTGAISFEFSSRGAQAIYSVDKNYNSIKFIKSFSIENNLNIIAVIADIFKSKLQFDIQFDIIFADPPYSNKKEYYDELISILRNKLDNSKGSLLILEHPEHIIFTNDKNVLEERKYGGCSFTFFIL